MKYNRNGIIVTDVSGRDLNVSMNKVAMLSYTIKTSLTQIEVNYK